MLDRLQYIEQLIDLYFDGLTDKAQEAELRRLLADTALTSDKIEQARAVLGYFAAARAVNRPARHKATRILPRLRAIDVAASVAIIAAFALAFINLTGRDDSSRCMAYANDIVIRDNVEVMGIMNEDLSVIREASADFQNEVLDQIGLLNIDI